MAEEPNPLDESLQKFLAGPKKKTETGIGYDPGATNPAAPNTLPVASFRPAVSDIVNVNQNPGKMYTEPELWANELAKQKLAQDILEQNRQYELKSKAANMENLMATLQLHDYLKSRKSGGTLRMYPGYGGGSRPSSGVRPQFTQVSVNPHQQAASNPGLMVGGGRYQGPVTWVNPAMDDARMGTMINQANKRRMLEGKQPMMYLKGYNPG